MCEQVRGSEELYPLSLSQHNIWDLERSFTGTSINTISTTIRIKGRVDFLLLEKAVNLIISSDSSLRARITLRGSVPMQYYAPYKEEKFPLFDFSMTDEAGIAHWETTLTREPMNFYDSPLYRFVFFRIDEYTAGVLVKTHHIISDGWTQVSLCNRIGKTYLELIAGTEPEVEQSPSYVLHIEEEQKYLSSAAYMKDKEYWRGLVEKATGPASIKNVKGAAVSPVGQRRSYKLPQYLNHAIYSFCMKNRVAPFAVYYMALAIYLKRIGGSDRFTIGVPVFNRTNHIFKKITGMFVSTVPFFGELNDSWSLNEFNEHLMVNWLELLRHQRFPFTHITEMSGASGPLFNIMLSYQDSKIMKSQDTMVLFTGRWHYGGYQSEHLCIHLTNLEDNRMYSVDYDYLTQIFSDKEIDDLHNSLCNILNSALNSPDSPIYDLQIVGAEELERLIYTYNNTDSPIAGQNLYSMLKAEALQHPERVALIYKGERLTYKTLLEQGGKVAAALKDPAELTAVVLPKTPELYFAITGIMQAGSAWVIIPPDTPRGRMLEILQQSGAEALLSTSDIINNLGDALRGIRTIDMNSLPAPIRDEAPATGESLAYVVYTSGSTGKPKGVEITQKNLINFVLGMRPLYAKGAVLSLCNTGFDAFILESAAALLCCRTIVLPEDSEQENPAQLAKLILRFAVGFIAITPSRLGAYIRDSSFAAALKNLDSIVCGGEAFPSELLQKLKFLTEARIYNQYGPSEATVGVSYCLLNNASQITVGKPMANCRFYVLDDRLHPLPTGVFGNLYIGGSCVGRGYRNAPQLTQECFLDSPFVLGETIYKTGDIAAWTEEGEITIAGRLDRQIKLRGLRVEPQEISNRLAAHPDVTDTAVKVISHNGQSVIVAYYTAPRLIQEAELLTFLASYLPRYMIPARIIRLDSIPLTPNGKVNEASLPVPEFETGYQNASNALQETLLSVFRRVLDNDDFHAGSDFFLCGGNSLNAMEALGEIEEKTGVRLRISDLYACRTVKRLDELLGGAHEDAHITPVISPAPALSRYPLSPIQKSIYVQSCIDPSGLAYNMAGAFKLSFEPDIRRLENAFVSLIKGDDSFRTAFVRQDGDVFAIIRDEVQFSLPILTGSREEVFKKFLRPFDLSSAPLLRAALWKEAEKSWILLVDSHHIISDGVSTSVIMERLNSLYRNMDFQVPLTYKDYAYYAQNSGKSGHESALDYWLRVLSPLPETLDIPFDSPRPSEFDFRGAYISFDISAELSGKADGYCDRFGITPFMLFLGAFGILVSKISGQKDLIVGTPVSCRNRQELMNICGPFINTLPLRLRPAGGPEAYFDEVKRSVIGMLDHQDIPLEELISKLELPRSLSHNPLYKVLFSMRPLDTEAFALDGSRMEYVPVPNGTTKLDLSLEAAREGNRYTFRFDYATSLFSEGTVALYGRSFVKIAEDIIGGTSSIEDIYAVSHRDKLTLLDKPYRTFKPYLDMPVNRIFEEAAYMNPDGAAVIWHDQKTTFRELNERADRIASLLVKHGARQGDRIGLVCRRTPDLLASLLGILKAGGAYLPFLADYPAERITYMLQNAGASLVLSDPESSSCLPGTLPCPVVLTTEPASPLTTSCMQQGTDPMYVLYTSGSTGQPKGVQVPHRAISNLLESLKELMNGLTGPVLCTTNVTFDIFVTESLLALAQGLCVVLADEEEMLLPWKTAELITRYHTGIAQFTPSRLQMNLTNNAFAAAAKEIELVILVGEVVTPRLLEKFKEHSSGRFINMYGPTEAAVYVTQGELFEGEPINIGKPLNNCRIYVLDENRKPVMPTARGELYLAGECLADGYISRPDLTDAVFVPDPHFPGRKMYKSGDLGRLRADGVFECYGRLDSQIKINGNRVELDEITGAMTGAGASQAATVALINPDGSTTIHGFVTPASIDVSRLKLEIGRVLLPYMIPSRITALDELPYNASGKVDLPALKKMAALQSEFSGEVRPLPVESVNKAPTIAPEPEFLAPEEDKVLMFPESKNQSGGAVSPDMLLEIWEESLGTGKLDPDKSFFEQGGSSLAALNVLSRYFNLNLNMTLKQFYENPTASQQAELLGCKEPRPAVLPKKSGVQLNIVDVSEASPTRTAGESPKTRYPSKVPAPKGRLDIKLVERVLLTGATGFLGAHLLRALLESGVYKVICLLRDGDRSRLLSILSRYFGDMWVKRNSPFIESVKGDVSLPMLGLNYGPYLELKEKVYAVYHSAADVRHYTYGTKSFDTNFRGTENIIEFALEARVPLIHISTVSICGEFLRDNMQKAAVFSESDFDIGQNWEDNVYVRSKFLAENAVYAAMGRGLDARVFRVGRLVGRAADGIFQINPESNAFYSLVRGIGALGALPRGLADMPVDLTPVDVCASAILALESGPMTAYHIIEPAPRPLSVVLKELFPDIQVVDNSRFAEILSNRSATGGGESLAPLIEMFNRLLVTPTKVSVSAEKTHKFLAETGFRWPVTIPGRLLAQFISE